MALKGLSEFQKLDLQAFLKDKSLVYLKATQWDERNDKNEITGILGSKVVCQIMEDGTAYTKDGVDNFGEQITVKVRGVAFNAYDNFTAMVTEVIITDVEKAVIWGDFKNQLSVIAVVKEKPKTKA
jgi:hypothetical protein